MEKEKLFRLKRGNANTPKHFFSTAIVLEREWPQAKLNGWVKSVDQDNLEQFREAAEEAVKNDYGSKCTK